MTRQQECFELDAEGIPRGEIGRRMGLSRPEVSSYISREKRKRKRQEKKPELTRGDMKRIKCWNLYSSGMPTQEIAKEMKETHSNVIYYIKDVYIDRGIPLEDGTLERYLSFNGFGKVLALHKAGWSGRDICAEFGIYDAPTMKEFIRKINEPERLRKYLMEKKKRESPDGGNGEFLREQMG